MSWIATLLHPGKPTCSYTPNEIGSLKEFFKNPHVTLVVTSSVTQTTHTFTDTKDLEREVEDARIYAGFHYHHSVVQGADLGKKVADQVSRDYFQPIGKGKK